MFLPKTRNSETAVATQAGQYFFDRTVPVVFVRVEFNKAYFIDICSHGHNEEDHVFAKQKLLEF